MKIQTGGFLQSVKTVVNSTLKRGEIMARNGTLTRQVMDLSPKVMACFAIRFFQDDLDRAGTWTKDTKQGCYVLYDGKGVRHEAPIKAIDSLIENAGTYFQIRGYEHSRGAGVFTW
jgi:hypothetical protein